MEDVQARRLQLELAIDEQWQYELHESPEFATTIGDYRYNHRWSDISLSHLEQQRRDLTAWLERFEDIDPTGFPEQEDLNRRLMVRDLRERLEGIELKNHEMLVDQLDGIHLKLAQFVALAPFDSEEHYEDYINRLEAIPRVLGQAVEVLEQGARDGLVPPRYLLEKTITQCESIAGPAGAANIFGRPAAEIPEYIPMRERERLYDGIVAAVDARVRPAYAELAGFIAKRYAPRGRGETGVWSLPDGEARYRFAVRRYTTTDMEPEAIHELGLEEVARIEAEQTAVAAGLGFSNLASFRESLKTERRLLPASREQIIDTYRRYVDRMGPELPKLFGLLPRTGLEIRPVQEYREKEASGAQYYPGTPDGSRPGIVYVNTGGYEQRSLIGAESTAYHEALPGHHLQIAIAQTLAGLPPFRQHAYHGAYMEGWALYSERLGKEIGFYEDPYSDFGRLSSELMRAARLVIDTGLHHKRWTRRQAVDYFRAHSDEDEADIQAEINRYLVLPGQALSYKIGGLEILRLREWAARVLGPRFDIRRFHDRILEGGALPLDVLGSQVEAWIGEEEPERA